MSKLVRFGVSIDSDLLERFDAIIEKQNYPTRSKAIEDQIRKTIAEDSFGSDTTVVVATINVIYDHHRRELLNKLTDIQHDFQEIVLSTQHIHLDHHNCFEIIVLKGQKNKLEELANKIKSAKGVLYSDLNIAAPQETKPHEHGRHMTDDECRLSEGCIVIKKKG